MQVQHEIQLIEGVPIEAGDFVPNVSQSLDTYTLTQANLNPIEHIVSSSTGSLIAVYLIKTNQIVLIDTKNYSKRERFPLKSCDKKFSKQSFALKGIDFSPDGMRLAIGQTDCIIYIYKLSSYNQSTSQTNSNISLNNITKPTITGKFVCSSPITCLIWTDSGIIFGTQDGKVKLISMVVKSTLDNQSSTSSSSSTSTKVIGLYNSPKGTMPLSLAFKGPIVTIGFVDGSVILVILSSDLLVSESNFNVTSADSIMSRRNSASPQVSFIEHSCPAYYVAIMLNNVICCAGSDGRIALHAIQLDTTAYGFGNKLTLDTLTSKSPFSLNWLQNIDLKEEIVAIDYSVINEILAVTTSTRLLFIKYDQELATWQLQSSFIGISNVSSITSVKWTKDGSQLAVGTLAGSLELFRCSWNKHSVGEQLDICHIAKNRVRITDRARNLLATYKTQHDIKRVNLLNNGQSVIIWTTDSLLLARLDYMQSEIQWARDKTAKFCFDHPGFVLIFSNSTHQLMVIKLGQDSIIYTIKLDSIRRSTVSVRQYPAPCRAIVDSPISNQQRSAGSPRSRQLSVSISEPDIQIDYNPFSEPKAFNFESLNERLAFVMDSSSLIVVNLKTGSKELIKRHDESIVYLELSHTSNNLLFRDLSNKLHLINLETRLDSAKTLSQLLMDRCEFARWLPESDILIAQSTYKISIWYNLDEINNVTELDSRSYNITNAPPLIDLSSAAGHQKKPGYPIISKICSDNLNLSNGYTVSLDKIKVKFYTEIVGCRLESAFEVLDKEDTKSNINLWNKLGWLAINSGNCVIAVKAFNRLGHTSMVECLKLCIESPEEKAWRLAMLKGDWDSFERIAEPDQIISTYKRLNKWSRAIDFFTKTQQFRQRDLVEQEFKYWLIDKGRYLEGAKIQAKSGDLTGAIKLLIENKKFEDAVDLFITEQKTPLKSAAQETELFDLARILKCNLIEREKFEKAAILCDKILDEPKEALDLYVKGKAFKPAIELAKLVAADRTPNIEESFGEHLMQQYKDDRKSRKQTLEAIDHFMAANQKMRALEVAIELMDFPRAYELLKSIKIIPITSILKEYSSLIGNFMLDKGNQKEAIEALLLGEHYNQVIGLFIEQGNFREAFDVSLRFIHSDNHQKAVEEFIQLANKLSECEKIDQAEMIYLMLDKPDLAIDMHRQRKNYDRMLELVDQFHPDSLESTLLLLARKLESEGKYNDAERYLFRANDSEWTNVVRMYRLAGKWADAYRVARNHCSSERDPLLVQLAYWWCKSLQDSESARNLLKQLNVLNSVMEFCCENSNFQMAIELCDSEVKLKSDIVKRYAAFLERQHKFVQAEEILVKFDQVEEAARMYVDNDMHSDAIRVVEEKLKKLELSDETVRQQLVDLLNKTLIQCANCMVEEVETTKDRRQQSSNGLRSDMMDKRLHTVQQMYLRAQRPELAVEMYKERGMWQEAIQVAQRFAPKLLESVERALDAQVADDMGPIVAAAIASQSSRISRSSSRSSVMINDNTGSQSNIIDNQETMVLRRQSETISPVGQQRADYLRGQAELSMRNGDLKGTMLALDKFLKSLAEETFHNDTSIGLINEWLAQFEHLLRQTEIISLSVKGTDIWLQVLALADKVAERCVWGQLNLEQEHSDDWVAWIRLRDVLVTCLETIDDFVLSRGKKKKDGDPGDNEKQHEQMRIESMTAHDLSSELMAESEQLERRLVITHYVTLHVCLVNQLQINLLQQQQWSNPMGKQRLASLISPAKVERLFTSESSTTNIVEILSLLAKLSLSLLRYTDLLEARGTFYNAGFWLLAAGRRDLARFAWTRLIELVEGSTVSVIEQELRRADVPEKMRLDKSSSGNLTTQQLNEVRSWLLETLIENRADARLALDERGELESSLNSAASSAGLKRNPLPACFVCGYPVFAGPNQLILGQKNGRKYQVRLSEWRSLLSMRRRYETKSSGSPAQRLARLQPAGGIKSTIRSHSVAILMKDIIDFLVRLSGANTDLLQ